MTNIAQLHRGIILHQKFHNTNQDDFDLNKERWTLRKKKKKTF